MPHRCDGAAPDSGQRHHTEIERFIPFPLGPEAELHEQVTHYGWRRGGAVAHQIDLGFRSFGARPHRREGDELSLEAGDADRPAREKVLVEPAEGEAVAHELAMGATKGASLRHLEGPAGERHARHFAELHDGEAELEVEGEE